jgi:hypothetical protein
MPTIALDPTSRQFLETLYDRTGNDTEAQVSMYDLGAAMGLDRAQSATTAEDLMAEGLLDIRTLSGAVALSQDGQALFNKEAAEMAAGTDNRLGQRSPMDERQRDLVERVLASLKVEMQETVLPYEALAEIIADVRTIEAQLASPHAKTVVVRVCLEGLRELAAAQGAAPWQERLRAVLA